MPRKHLALPIVFLRARIPQVRRYEELANFLASMDDGTRSVWIREALLDQMQAQRHDPLKDIAEQLQNILTKLTDLESRGVSTPPPPAAKPKGARFGKEMAKRMAEHL